MYYSRDDLLGLDGMVKIKNPDENVNHLPSVGKYISQNKDDCSILNHDELTKRMGGNSNPHRSLPDIPIYTEGDVQCSDNGVSGDTSSDLYATVEDKASSSNRHSLPNGIQSRGGAEHPPLIENPYDKVNKSENPYAKVQSADYTEEYSRTNSISGSAGGVELRGTDSSSSGGAGSSSRDIPAAVAVAGRVAASQELPYMTPPLEVIHDIDTPTVDQSHFSGDSQDSSKGYTSISVREPLQHICGGQDTSRVLTSHYATVSDDSDDNMYAAIAEPSSAHAPYGSETYAQIEVSTDMVVAAAVTIPQQHSRQPSSSSCTSSTANVGSPKPEKRQANSPLPPPPQRTIEDMYAKVHKTPRRRLDEDPTTSVPHEQDKERPSNALTEATAQDSEPVPDSDLDHCYETLSKASKKLSLHKSDVSDVDVGYERIRNRTAINTELKTVEHGYEQLSHSRISSETDPNYETLRPQNNNNHDHAPLDILDGYSVVKKPPKHKHDPAHYATLQQKSTESESEPNYESVKYLDVTLNEPPYERLGDSQYSDLSESSPSKNSHSTPDYERIRGGDNSKSSDNSEGSSKLPTDIRNEQKTQDTLHLDNINVEEIIEKNTDENMYFQV